MRFRGFCTPALALLLTVGITSTAAAGDDFATSFASDFERTNRKLVALAEEIPANKYDWRPAEGVRSVSEVLAHVAFGNFLFPSSMGAELPEDFDPQWEKSVTGKQEVLELLRRSIANVEEFMKTKKSFDGIAQVGKNEFPEREAIFILSGHTHEHLGQTIAYARSMGVAPPWDSPLGPER